MSLPERPTVSVIVVTYNGREHLERLLPSVFSADYPADRLEVICVDNGSVDGTAEMLQERYPQVRLLRNERNEGFAGPNNQAAAVAGGEILALVNNDMRVAPDWLLEALPPLLEDPQTAAVGCRILSWDGSEVDFAGGTVHFAGFPTHPDLGRSPAELEVAGSDEQAYREALFACGGAMLVRRQVFLDTGGFDANFFAVLEDVDLGWRLWLAGHRVRLAPSSVVYHRRHGTLRRGGREKHRYLLLRNALLMVMKNYSDESLGRVLPAIFQLALRRVLEGCRIQRENFYFWSDAAFAETYEVPRKNFLDSITEAVALDEALGRFDELKESRKSVQALRKVPDAEILSRFDDPFRLVWKEPGTLALEEQIAEFSQLSDLFREPWPSGGERRARMERYELELSGRIRQREKELELMTLRLEMAQQGLDSYLHEIREGRPLDPTQATRRKLPLRARLSRIGWIIRFYYRFEGIGGVLRRSGGFLLRRIGLSRPGDDV